MNDWFRTPVHEAMRLLDAASRRLLWRFALAFFVAHTLSLLLIRFGGPIAVAWPPSGVALGALLAMPTVRRRDLLAGVVVLDMLSSALQGFLSVASMTYLSFNLIEVLVIERVLRAVSREPLRFGQVRDVMRLVVVTSVVSALVAIPAGSLHFGSGPPAPHPMISWWTGDMIAYLIVTPLAVLLVHPPEAGPPRPRRWKWAELVGVQTASIVVGTLAFTGTPLFHGLRAHAYMMAIPLLWSTLRFGQIGTLLTLLALSSIGVITLLAGVPGGFAAIDPSLNYVAIELFLCVQAVLAMVLATTVRSQHEAVAEKARMVEQVRASEERLRQSQKLEAVGQLAGGIAHDFNNVLAAALLQLEELRVLRDLPAEATTIVGEVDAVLQRAARVTRQLLVFSRREAMQPHPQELNALLQALTRLLRRAVPASHALTVVPWETPLVAAVDSGMIEQVVLNLVINARDAIDGTGEIRVELAAVAAGEEPAQLPRGSYAVIRVIDTGCGITEADMPRLFEPFFTTKPPGRGTGLGLATAYGIVQQHGGTITAQSTQGVGSTFSVWLPRSADPGQTSAPTAMAQEPPAEPSAMILVIEDEAALRRALHRVLERAGYTVRAMGTAREALDRWPSLRGQVDLILTDLVMPGGVSGTQFAEAIRQESPDTPIVFTSGYDPQFDPSTSQMSPGVNFIAKPARADEILTVVRKQLAARAGEARRTSV